MDLNFALKIQALLTLCLLSTYYTVMVVMEVWFKISLKKKLIERTENLEEAQRNLETALAIERSKYERYN